MLSDVLILGINRVMKHVQITAGGRRYTCPTKLIGNDLFFKFRKEWHNAFYYTSEYTTEFFEEGGKNFIRKLYDK